MEVVGGVRPCFECTAAVRVHDNSSQLWHTVGNPDRVIELQIGFLLVRRGITDLVILAAGVRRARASEGHNASQRCCVIPFHVDAPSVTTSPNAAEPWRSLAGWLQGRSVTKNRNGGQVRCNAWFCGTHLSRRQS